jgi:hypothetical protein
MAHCIPVVTAYPPQQISYSVFCCCYNNNNSNSNNNNHCSYQITSVDTYSYRRSRTRKDEFVSAIMTGGESPSGGSKYSCSSVCYIPHGDVSTEPYRRQAPHLRKDN